MKEEKDLGSPDCPDGSDLICGLIKELSWLKLVPALHVNLQCRVHVTVLGCGWIIIGTDYIPVQHQCCHYVHRKLIFKVSGFDAQFNGDAVQP